MSWMSSMCWKLCHDKWRKKCHGQLQCIERYRWIVDLNRGLSDLFPEMSVKWEYQSTELMLFWEKLNVTRPIRHEATTNTWNIPRQRLSLTVLQGIWYLGRTTRVTQCSPVLILSLHLLLHHITIVVPKPPFSLGYQVSLSYEDLTSYH